MGGGRADSFLFFFIFSPPKLGETKPLDTHVNSEIWLYFTMQKKKIPNKLTFSVVFTN